MCAWWRRLFERKPVAQDTAAARLPIGVLPNDSGRRVRRVTVGLDFGTAYTKCCFREQGNEKPFFIVGHEPSPSRAARVLVPTAVACREGKLFFGYRAEQAGMLDCIRSFKMCLFCQARAESGSATNAQSADRCPNCLAERPGHFRIGTKQLSAEDVASLYLAVVLREAKQRVEEVLGDDTHELRVSVNSAAPLDQMSEFGEVGACFERMLYCAWMLTAEAHNPWQLEDALSGLERARKEPQPAPEMSPTRVFPETHAAMTAYLLLPQTEKGLYGSVDIGAGTTDVAFLWLQKDEQEAKAWYYATGSKRIGMDDVDRALEPILQVQHAKLRAAREALGSEDLQAYRSHVEPIAKRIYQHQASVLHDAMTVDQRSWAWFTRDGAALYRLFLVGGGSTCSLVTEPLRRAPPRHHTRWQDAPYSLSIPSATNVALPGGDIVRLETLSEPVAERLCLLAYGLSHPRPDIPKYERDAEGVRVEVKVREPPAEQTGHWW